MSSPDGVAVEALVQARRNKQVLVALIETLYHKRVLTDPERRQLQRKLR